MSKEWIIDVLGDVRGFANANGLPNLAKELESALLVASVEISPPPPVMGRKEKNAAYGRRTGTYS